MLVVIATINDPVHEELSWAVARCRAPRVRTHCEWAEDEIVLPEGPYYGTKLRLDRQPFTRLLLAELDSGRWTRSAVVGCVQGGKSLIGFVEPTLYHLFECRETVICGLPTMDIAGDKFREELLPVIERSRYRNLLPARGPASRGGTGHLEFVKFAHGPTLKFMTAGGGDAKRSSFTARVVVITEADKMDTAGETSREADPVSQLEARMLAYAAALRRFYMECTVSIATGRIWREYTAGTASRIACPCPHCRQYITPEREHLVGWQAATSELEARRLATFVCPDCAVIITPEERVEMNRRAVLVHRGQEIDSAGKITGPLPETDTLGFRWNAFNNLFWQPGEIGAKEWAAREAADDEGPEKELCQFYWAWPYTPPDVQVSSLTPAIVQKRTDRKLPRGLLPADTIALTAGLDLGKFLVHYVITAWRSGGRAHIADYGVLEIDADRLGVQRATMIALKEFAELAASGWQREGGEPLMPQQVWIDSGWFESVETVYQFCREQGERYRPSKGYGATQQKDRYYKAPTAKTQTIRHIGEGFHLAKLRKARIVLCHVNADFWKSWVHERLSTPAGEAGSMGLFHAPPAEHTKFAHHLTAERPVVEFLPGRGEVLVWKRHRRANHWLDALCLAAAAGHMAGFRIMAEAARAPRAEAESTSWFAQQKKRQVNY